MEIKTKPYGLVDINEEDIITFEQGIIGFEGKHKFVLLGGPNDMLVWLQSVEDEKLAFVVIQPRYFKSDYKPAIHFNEIEDLGAESHEDLLLYSIVVVPKEAKKMTANLKAPIIINVKNNKAKQLILNDETYNVRELILA